MNTKQKENLIAIVFIILLILFVIYAPLIVIWALNIIFPMLVIPYTFKTWLAIIVVCSIFNINKANTKSISV